eukprot:870429-Amphidinium_carterae.1
MLDGSEKPMGFKEFDLLPKHDVQHVILPDGSLLSHIHFGTRIQTTQVTHPAIDKDHSGVPPAQHGGQLLTSANYLPVEKTSARRQLVERTPAEIDAGFAYINAHAPRVPKEPASDMDRKRS